MKKIIDNDTGEIIEVPEKNEVVEKKLFELGAIDEETYEFLEKFQTIQEQFEIFKYKLQKAMAEHNIKSWKNDYFTATFKPETYTKRVDVERLKEDGLYEKYLKLSPVKESLQIRFKKGRE